MWRRLRVSQTLAGATWAGPEVWMKAGLKTGSAGACGVKERARVGVGIGCTWSIPGREGWLRVAAAGGSHATRRAHPAAGRR